MIRSWGDIEHALKMLAAFVVPLAAMMVVEKLRDEMSLLGSAAFPNFRSFGEGVIRCQGPFGHSILAGTFGASLIPLFMAMTRQGKGFNPLPGLD